MSAKNPTQRNIIVISGCFSDTCEVALKLTKKLQTLNLENPKKAQQYLGQEFDAVIFNAQDLHGAEQFDPNAFGAVAGTIRAGGYLLLLKPHNWSRHSLFLQRFDRQLAQQPDIQFIDCRSIEAESTRSLAPLAPRQTHASNDQDKAVQAIIKVVKGHRRRPLVITADRGRGKSAALGIAAAQLYQQGCEKIIVCAPSKKTAEVVFQYAKNTPLQFYSPDELQQKNPSANLVLIDEAAAIPVPLLSKLVKQYSRIVFATTQHGYEGSGRGFAISFKKILDSVAPEWKSCELTQPIRWDENDTVEQFVYQALLLNADAINAELITDASIKNSRFAQIPKKELLNNESLLKEVFGLLVTAHYQTRPSDFRQMLDDSGMRICALNYKNHIIAIALTAKEGGIDSPLAKEIFAGTRRIRGHLVAQALAANIGLPEAPCLKGQRILRIAVHPVLQQQGFGTHLLKSLAKYIEDENQVDYLSTSFGASTSLVRFWKKSGFTPVYLSIKRDASSGTHSVIMLNSQSKTAKQMQITAEQSFTQAFPYLLSDPFRHLESDIAFELLQDSNELQLTKNDIDIITAFAKAQRGYENSYYPIWKIALARLASSKTLSQEETALIILKVFQKHSWQTCDRKLDNNLKIARNSLSLLRKSTLLLLEIY